MSRCRPHAMLHNAAGAQDPKRLVLYCSSLQLTTAAPHPHSQTQAKLPIPRASQSNKHMGPPFGADKLAPRHVLPATRVFRTRTAAYQ